MKYSQSCHRISTLIKELVLLNPNTVFECIDNNTIVTNLSGKNLIGINLPLNTIFLDGNDETCHLGCIYISYYSQKVKITSDVISNCCKVIA